MNRQRIALGVGASAFDRIAISVMQLVLVPVLATHWGLERFGGWALLLTIPSLLALGDLGFGGAAVVRMTMEVARGQQAAARATVRSAAQLLTGACAVLFVLVCGLVWLIPSAGLPHIPGEGSQELRLSVMLLAGYTCLVLYGALLQGVFRSTARFALGTVLSTSTYLLENTLVIVAAVSGQGLLGGVVALLAGRLIGFALVFLAAARLRTGLLPGLTGGDPAVRRELVRPALAIMSIPLASALLLQGTVAALGLAVGAVAVPAFVAARTLSRIGLQATQVLTGALMPEFGAASARGHDRNVLRMFVLLAATATVIAVPFAAVLALAGPWIVKIWSNQQIIAPHGLMLAIAASALCGALWKPISDLMLAVNRQAEFALAYAGLAMAGVAFTIIAAPALGSTAAALALALVDLAMLALVFRFARRNWAKPGSIRPALAELWHEVRSGVARFLYPEKRG
ncbi:MAG: lipopolysaccharide biosynthesis protein [Novosphingobium sp.]